MLTHLTLEQKCPPGSERLFDLENPMEHKTRSEAESYDIYDQFVGREQKIPDTTHIGQSSKDTIMTVWSALFSNSFGGSQESSHKPNTDSATGECARDETVPTLWAKFVWAYMTEGGPSHVVLLGWFCAVLAHYLYYTMRTLVIRRS